MSFKMNLEEFLIEAGYTENEWAQSALDWDELLAIATSHEAARKSLVLHGSAIANRIQEFEGVHSVRWRVKDTFGLLKKILRKNLDPKSKPEWRTISVSNYRSVVSDLVGVRALHLLKNDCIRIDQQIREIWNVYDVTIFKRLGDTQLTEIIELGAKEQLHDDGYRSIHYSHDYKAEKDPILIELQVRTLFQEGWSEIDHKVKYPDFSDNETLKYFLGVFNGLAGTADDMGSFVIQLNSLIETTTSAMTESAEALAAKDSDIEKLQSEIDKLRTEGQAPASTIDSLQSSVDNIKEKNKSHTKNALLSRAMFDIYVPRSLSDPSDALKMIRTSFGPSSELKAKLENIKSSSMLVADTLNRINLPTAEFVRSLQAANKPSIEAIKALDTIISPATEIAKALKVATQPIEELSKAMEKLNEPNAELVKAISNLDKPNTELIKAFEAINRPSEQMSAALKALEDQSKKITDSLSEIKPNKKPKNPDDLEDDNKD